MQNDGTRFFVKAEIAKVKKELDTMYELMAKLICRIEEQDREIDSLRELIG